MNDNNEPISLLPYLRTDRATFHLEMALGQQDSFAHQTPSSPFLVASDSGALSKIIEARINTDALTQVEPVSLLIQKDEYRLLKSELWPLNNAIIDQYWQHTFSFYSRERFGNPPLLLKGQIGKKGQLLPFGSLFFCNVKQTYFEPSCPSCGMLLKQCHSDGMLEENKLLPYSSSLKRYLFCPACAGSKEKPEFYVFSLEDNDPAFLKNRFELIKTFKQLRENTNLSNFLPCIDCAQYQACYGSENLAISRVIPFSFYPFYMLVFKTDSINALDFISMISGASYQELENQLIANQHRGRLNRIKLLKQKNSNRAPFFFRDEDRHFLEVLYLKLSFLGEIAETIFSGLDHYQYPEIGLSIDRIWVKLADQNSLLPSLWNFKLEMLDVIGADIQPLTFPKLPKSYGLHILGVVWFYTLLVNKKQDISDVYSALGEAFEEIGSENDSNVGKYLNKKPPQVFSPENIFWDFDTISVSEYRHELWSLSLRLGFNVFEGSMVGLEKWSEGDFKRKLERLRKQIKEELFRPDSHAMEKGLESGDEAISNILFRFMNSWQKEIEMPPSGLEKTIPQTESNNIMGDEKRSEFHNKIDDTIDDRARPGFQAGLADTIDDGAESSRQSGLQDTIDDRTQQSLRPEFGPGKDDGITEDFQEGTDITETVMVTPKARMLKKLKEVKKGEDPEKTVIISSDDIPSSDKSKSVFHQDECLEDTISTSFYPSNKTDRFSTEIDNDLDKSLLFNSNRSDISETEDLSETVIISPRRNGLESRETEFRSPHQNMGYNDAEKTEIWNDEMPKGKYQKTRPRKEDEFLEDTIITQPDRMDPRKNKK